MNAQLPRPGDIVDGKYVIDTLIGQGGMGAVFKAKHRVTGGVRAIKIMLAESGNAEARQRFMNEARAAAEIQNEHVVRVDDVGEELGYAFMVLELLQGEDLAQVLDREKRPLAPHVAVGYVLQALRGVAQAHALGIVHRDLKPSNLFLSKRSDGTETVKVLDFGISKASATNVLSQSPSALTSTKAMLGSPLYMSPEQLRSSKSVDQRADIWAVGIILFELITCSLPFMGDNLGELFAAILEMDAPPLSSRAQGVSPGLDAVVLKCLKRRPEDRWQTAKELIEALGPFAQAAGHHGSTAFMQPGYVPSPATPTGPHPHFAATPQPGHHPMPPRHGAITGNGSAPRAIPGQPGTVAMGATPSAGMMQNPGFPGASTNSSWQAEPVVPTNKPPVAIIATVGAVVLALMIGGGVLAVKSKKGPDADPTTANPPPSTSVAAPNPIPTPTETTAVPTPSASAAVTVATTAGAAHTAQPAGHVPSKPPPQPTKVEPKPPEPVKPPPEPVKPAVTPTPTPKPTTNGGAGVQTR